jgi:hypothetical protein
VDGRGIPAKLNGIPEGNRTAFQAEGEYHRAKRMIGAWKSFLSPRHLLHQFYGVEKLTANLS